MIRIALAVVHLLALGIGLGAIYARARALNALTAPDGGGLRRVFAADTWWGIAFGLWIITGFWRALGGLEKAPSYYWNNHIFYAKLGFLALILALEVWPMITLIRWRRASQRQMMPALADLAPAGRRMARISDVQTLLVIAIVVAAVMIARGYGLRM